ncbi:MAG: Glycosyl transferase group 1 [Candidatus Daviesbacteria bacterium GW2011_GWA2_38_24]|uniref:Glycosyl transferase group 1 n=1 Tax=Candidatus Daviesbacteria bacterium GW2011_GWA2_38_24 TaxID=1618422 RepID=A0A0G0MQJ1_9BACT|nr:MAG: Glycosyl transferase group 1 [Candidatus Daviesbacteria bacterium GW2011_GWA2_38_24]KKQ80524.1 MAG: Glycosyl transferase group 1 [Candidatus Daviesbacteria bacterium GW2011_GWA1_38_7]OGE23313.1 MAG: hypothetical protein A2688_04385 [Candidatus Daviesbacteria bacterium RIFCSPHIGHO2_01_FULL_38_8]
MKVALVHDDLVQWGGAERVLHALTGIFPDASIFTSLFDKQHPILKNKFREKHIHTSFLQKIPGKKALYKAFLPLYPLAFEQFDLSSYDLVISHTTRFAKAIITRHDQVHICYCHTPPRFLWNFPSDNLPKMLDPLFNYLRLYDQIISKRINSFIAGSFNAQSRIKKIYGQNAFVLQPFVDFSELEGFENFDGGYFLVISRLNKYKNVDIVVNTFKLKNAKLKIIGIGPEFGKLKQLTDNSQNIEFLGAVSENLRLSLLAGCKALIVAAEEDFGLTPLEAQALGKPVIALKKGGALETVVENETGVFFDTLSVLSLEKALKKFEGMDFKTEKCINNAKRFSKENFVKNLKDILENLGLI